MATLTAALLHGLERNTPRSKRKQQKHLRSTGQAYISRTGKLIPAKKVAEELCQCPQKCDERVPMELRERLFAHFYGMGDTDQQNAFLREHMDVRPRQNISEMTSSGRAPRRISCKYLVPSLTGTEKLDVCQKAFVSAFVITTKRVRLQREKLISSMGLNVYGQAKAIKSENMDDDEEQESSSSSSLLASSTPVMTSMLLKIPAQCEMVITKKDEKQRQVIKVNSCKRRLVDDPFLPLGLVVPEGVTIAPVIATPDHDRDIAIVNNFFSNQLWKPEYILGTYS